MKSIKFGTSSSKLSTMILANSANMQKDRLEEIYVDDLVCLGFKRSSIEAHEILVEDGKVKRKLGMGCLRMLLDGLSKRDDVNLSNIIVTDATYFKILTGAKNSSSHYGEKLKAKFEGFKGCNVIYVPNHTILNHVPSNREKIYAGLISLAQIVKPTIIDSAEYVYEASQAEKILQSLHKYDALSCDVITDSDKINSSILCIAFAWDKANGAAIYLDAASSLLMINFFKTYKGALVFHDASTAIKHIVYDLFMLGPNDYVSMQEGLNCFERLEDTMLLAYLANNSTQDLPLDLQYHSYEYASNNLTNTSNPAMVSPKDLMTYSLVNAMAIWHVGNKYNSIIKDENQTEAYVTIFRPSVKPIVKMMLVGLPINMRTVDIVRKNFQMKLENYLNAFNALQYVQTFNNVLRQNAVNEANMQPGGEIKTIKDFAHISFNPNSPERLRMFLYQHCGFTTENRTKTGLLSTDETTLNQLRHQTVDQEIIDLIIAIRKTSKVIGSYLNSFEKHTTSGFLHGKLILGGTQSGRLSSKDPSLHNHPTGDLYGKPIKSCFQAPEGWLLGVADLNAVEERAGTILTNDPNRIKIYVQGYDSHCFRAFHYFGNQMTGVVETPDSINAIATDYPELRQMSKEPTFLLQYEGTHRALHKSAGLPIDQAVEIENKYRDLYKATIEFNEKNYQFATEHGYVECAFGLRLRTPLLHNFISGSSNVPESIQAERRSANNAVTQSWGMLVNRAIIETNRRVEMSDMCYDIFLVNMIHDSVVVMFRNTPKTLKFLNDTLIKELEWNNHQKIYSKDVPMKAVLEVGASLDKLKPIKNYASLSEAENFLSQNSLDDVPF